MRIIVHLKPVDENNWNCVWCKQDVREVPGETDLFLRDGDTDFTLEYLQTSINHHINEYVGCWHSIASSVQET